MLSITPTVNVFLAIDPVDMRKGFHGLTSLTESILSQNRSRATGLCLSIAVAIG